LGLALLTGGAGCRNCDLVEAELRTLERDLGELKNELFRSEAQNEALQREVCALRQGGPVKVTPEEASQQFTVRQIVLGRGTGGHDTDGWPGDEALEVVLEPRDGDNHAIKASGTLYVEAVEINREGMKSFLSSWDVPPEQLRPTWRSGLFSTGYHVVLPWKAWPTSDKVRVTARFTLPDGRSFEADRDVTIRPTPVAKQKALPAAPVGPPAVVPPELPLPRKVDPPAPAAPQARWWDPAPAQNPIQQTMVWQAKKRPLNEAIELLRPVPLPPAPPPPWAAPPGMPSP
jgi:hypothetical protein